MRELARECALAGDTLRADSLLDTLSREFPFWAPQALRRRADLALASGDTVRADGLLARADPGAWTDAERADWMARRAALRLALGDSAQAIVLARQVVRRFPSLAPAPRALALLERALAAHDHALPVDDERSAAEVDVLRGDRAGAARRLARVFAASRDPGRWRIALRQAEVLRADRRFEGALLALAGALAAAVGAPARDRIALERARVRRDAGASNEAVAGFEAASGSADSAVRATATWELARELESRGEWPRAFEAYSAIARGGDPRREDAAFHAGLTALAQGRRDSAMAWFGLGRGEGARFWQAVLLRPRALMVADTTLRALASAPGYSFHRVAARESLGVGGWPGGGVAACVPSARGLSIARRLIELGDPDGALALLERWAAGDARLHGPAGLGEPVDIRRLLTAAAVASAAGRFGSAIRFAALALDSCAADGDSARWAVVPWLYPPAFEAELGCLGVWDPRHPEPALLAAVMWQESKFNPRARSRSDALGLFQLKLGTAGDVAGWLREPPPGESALFDSALSVRYGARYLRQLIGRFGGDTLLAIAAYNAGPSTIERWMRIRTWSNPALDCELIARPETEDYVKRILAVRAAYRELRPTAAPDLLRSSP